MEANVDTDPVVLAYRHGIPLVDRLQAIQVEQAKAAAELSWMRLHPGEYGDDLLEAARAVTRRVRALRRLSELDIAQARASGPQGVDPASPEGQRVLALLFDRIAEVAHDVLPAVADELVGRFAADLAADPEIPWPPTPPPDEVPPKPEAAA